MNYLTKIFLLIISLCIFSFITFLTFFSNEATVYEKIDFPNTEIWIYNLTNNWKNKFSLNKINKILPSTTIYDQISGTSNLFVINWDYSKINNWNKTEVNLKSGLFLFNIKEWNDNINIKTNWFKIDNLSIGTFLINMNDPNKTLIFSIDSILNLSLLNNENNIITKINLYPHLYLNFNINKLSKSLYNSDALKISKILNINSFNKNLFNSENNSINKDLIKLLTLENKKYDIFIQNSLNYLKNQLLVNDIKKFFETNIWLTIKYIDKYFVLFVNKEKKKIYYKNLILKNILLLNKEVKKSLFIETNNYYNKLKEIDKVWAKQIKNLINYIYLNSFNIENNNILITKNIWFLISYINDYKLVDKSDLLILKKIYNKYDIIENNNVLDDINNFIEKYTKNNELSKQEIDYLLLFIWNIIEVNPNDLYVNTDNIIKTLDNYMNILTDYSYNSTVENTKTSIYNINNILKNIFEIFRNKYFEKDRTKYNLLKKKNISINNNTLIVLDKSIKSFNKLLESNLEQINDSKSSEILINSYKKNINAYNELILALDDTEKYESEYNKVYNLLYEDSINTNSDKIYINSKKLIWEYFSTFKWTNLRWTKINAKNKLYCNNPIEKNNSLDEDTYCFEIQKLSIINNGKTKKINFLFFPYENNKIWNISVNTNDDLWKIVYPWTYILNSLKESLDEELKKSSKNEERIKYDFKNFFINTFNKSEIIKVSNNDNNNNNSKDFLQEEDKIIKTFKRNKLLWEKWDFAMLKGFLDIKYDELKVLLNKENTYSISIIDSMINTQTNISNIRTSYKIIFNSDYLFYPYHSFENINLKFIDTNKKENLSYLLFDNKVSINWKIEITNLNKTIATFLHNFNDIQKITKEINNFYKTDPNKNLIEYNALTNNIKFKFNINNKILNINLYSWKITKIDYNSKVLSITDTDINKLKNILNTIK